MRISRRKTGEATNRTGRREGVSDPAVANPSSSRSAHGTRPTARSPVHVITFLRHTLENFHHTGAVAPSSPWLARALCTPLTRRGDASPLTILEAGPGTGALTLEIVQHLRPDDHLTLCEINACFVSYLHDMFREDPRLRPFARQVTIHHGPVEDLDADGRFDHVISGLPFNNFPAELVRQIFESFERAVRPRGTVNFFEYACIRTLKAQISGAEERRRLLAVEDVIHEFIHRHEHRRQLVLFNVPPAWAWSLHDFGRKGA